MGEFIGINRKARRAYGLDEISIVPGTITMNPEETDPSLEIGDLKLPVPILASAMDGVVDVKFAQEMGKLGGLAVLNLEGLNTRYESPREVIQEVVEAKPEESTQILQKLYQKPISKELVEKCIQDIKSAGKICGVSSTPQQAVEFGPIAQGAGADVFVIQSTVATKVHIAENYQPLDFEKFCKETMDIPVIIGNCVTFEVAIELMGVGAGALLIGVGPGAACTTRGVLGIGVPQITATVDCAYARDVFYRQTGKYVPIITDGGMSRGGDICKALACGGDGVMIGSAFAKTYEAPGRGFHWGMATPHFNLPRGTRIHVGQNTSLKQVLFGPANLDDGSQNLVGAIQTAMGNTGAANLREFHEVELVIAPSIQHEGKVFQKAQMIGMGKTK